MAEQSNLTQKECTKALNAFIDIVQNSLRKGEKVQLVGFGTFGIVQRAERKMTDSNTGEIRVVPKHVAPKFKPGKKLKENIR